MGVIGTGQVGMVWGLLVIFAILATAEPAVSSGKDDEKQPVDRTRIVMLTRAYSENVAAFSTNALKVMCDELEVTGFTVVRETSDAEMETSLKRTVSDSLYRHQSYVAVVVLRSSQTEGTVTLFGRKGLDEVVDLDSMYVEFPMNRDKAELVAFKVSEKVALLSEGLTYSPSPVVEITTVKPEPEPAPGKSNREKAMSSAPAPARRNRPGNSKYGLFLHTGALYGLRWDRHSLGFLAGFDGGFRWYPRWHKAVDFEVLYCPWSNTVSWDEVGKAGISLLMIRHGVSHVFRFNDIFSLSVGGQVGVGKLTSKAEDTFYDRVNIVSTTDIKDIKAYAGIGAGIQYQVHRNIVIPIRISLGTLWPEEKITVRLVDKRGEKLKSASSYFGPVTIEAFIGILVVMK